MDLGKKHMPADERLSIPPLLTAQRSETTANHAVCISPPSNGAVAAYRSRIKSRYVNLQRAGLARWALIVTNRFRLVAKQTLEKDRV